MPSVAIWLLAVASFTYDGVVVLSLFAAARRRYATRCELAAACFNAWSQDPIRIGPQPRFDARGLASRSNQRCPRQIQRPATAPFSGSRRDSAPRSVSRYGDSMLSTDSLELVGINILTPKNPTTSTTSALFRSDLKPSSKIRAQVGLQHRHRLRRQVTPTCISGVSFISHFLSLKIQIVGILFKLEDGAGEAMLVWMRG